MKLKSELNVIAHLHGPGKGSRSQRAVVGGRGQRAWAWAEGVGGGCGAGRVAAWAEGMGEGRAWQRLPSPSLGRANLMQANHADHPEQLPGLVNPMNPVAPCNCTCHMLPECQPST